MSYGVALRNGIPFTLGTIAALCVNATSQWSPAALWPTGTEPGMWIDPSNLTSQWQDSAGTTPVSTPGTVADSSNPVGLALDLRLGATVLTDPGNHLLQATSTARPLVSARVNWLTYTGDFGNAAWTKDHVTVSAPSTTSGVTTNLVTATAENGRHQVSVYTSQNVGTYSVSSAYVKAGTATKVGLLPVNNTMPYNYANTHIAEFDLASGTVVSAGADNEATITPAEDGGYVITVRALTPAPFPNAGYAVAILGPGYEIYYLANGTESIYVGEPQIQSGTTASDYQAILTDGSTYSPTGFPYYQKYDGTDDGMATASFAAGTLSSAMDCMIAVRRDSTNHVILGPYAATGDLGHYIGNAESGYDSACCTGVGSPTVWVDGAQLTHGWASELYTAVTMGDWHIIEFRGLDMSAWTALGFFRFEYAGYNLNGAFGGILLFPSSTSTADRDAARTWLGNKVGLTL